MIGYATVTGTKRNVEALRAAKGWGWLFSAAGWLPTHDWVRGAGIKDCIGDSGAWHYHNHGKPFSMPAYLGMLAWIAPLLPRFVMLPDIVGGGERSLELSLATAEELDWRGLPAALVVQDGMDPRQVGKLLGPDLAVCIGGSTEWKLETMAEWCGIANERGAWAHVLRVNTARRIRACERAGAHSFDGTSASMFSNTVPMLDRHRRTQDIDGYLARNPR